MTSFPANKLVRGQSPSVAMHLPIPFERTRRKFRGGKSWLWEEIGHGERDDEW